MHVNFPPELAPSCFKGHAVLIPAGPEDGARRQGQEPGPGAGSLLWGLGALDKLLVGIGGWCKVALRLVLDRTDRSLELVSAWFGV